jgi:hypothetical protein
MKTILKTILIVGLFTSFTAKAQQRAALHNNGNTTIYSGVNPFVDAYNASIDGDTIYLSGGGFVSPSTLDKGLTIFGAGFHPDSTMATYPTFITTSNVYLGENADSLRLEGLELINVYKNRDVQINSFTIKRCKTASLSFSHNGAPTVTSMQFELLETIVLGTANINGMSNSIISNCIFQSYLDYSSNNNIQNNIFLHANHSSYAFNNVYTNNIFSNTSGLIVNNGTGNTFEKNIFSHPTPNLGIGAIDNNNYKNVDLSSVYVNQAGFGFDYAHDYHLLPAAASSYIGTDGIEVGIYGGLFPYKEGAVPMNPHVHFKNIAPQTTPNGDLNIQIKVAAQGN